MLDAPWSSPRGTENELKGMSRALLPASYPDDLARNSTPETGSIGDKSIPIKHREPPFRGMKRSR